MLPFSFHTIDKSQGEEVTEPTFILTRVSFSGSSAETVEKAKAFWKCKNPPPEQKSTLAVSGINHRLKRAPQVGEGSLKHRFKTSLGTKQLTSPKRSYITLNCKLAAPPLSRIIGSRRW